tara:strand:- start:116 stop:301 length:186 start_codon:yes stop_codon:yes gene_type:complete
MNQEEIQKLVDLRMTLMNAFFSRKDYKSNRNAIMREIEHVEILNNTIKELDEILAKYVNFS